MSVNRLTGMVSGMDTDKMVKELIKAEQTRVDKVYQEQTYKTWEQDAYRDALKKIKAFSDTYFDVLKPESNMRSASMFSKFTSTVTLNGTSSDILSVIGSEKITSFEHKVDSITQLATKDTYNGSDMNLSGIKSKVLDFGSGVPPTSLKFTMSVDGVSKNIELDMATGYSGGAVDTAEKLASALNAKISTAFGSNFGTIASAADGKVQFDFTGTNVRLFQTSGDTTASMTWLGVASGTSNVDYLAKNVGDMLGLTETDLGNMKINGKSLKDMGVKITSTLSEMTKIIGDDSVAKATLKYNAVDDTFVLSATNEGSANNLDISSDLGTKLKLNLLPAQHKEGKNAILSIDGTTIIKSSNTFAVDGLTYTLNKEYTPATAAPIDIKLKTDTTSIVDKIKGFVETYNALILDLNTKISDKKNRNYLPLTEEQKSVMTTEQIKVWEDKSKVGVLRSSTEITNLLANMRRAVYETVEGAGISMNDIGISASSNYKENGKLILDETKLKTAIETKYSQVVKLFTASSDKEYMDYPNASERYRESGVGVRFHDIMQDAIRITRNNDGKKGSIVEKAGMEGDVSYYTNEITTKLTDYTKRINDLKVKLYDKQEYYYNMFAKMEQSLSKMNSQSSWITQQMGGSSS